MKIILARIWAFWGIVSFVATFLIILPPSLIANLFKDYKKGQIYFLKVARIWMRCWLFLVGCPVKVFGKEHFNSNESFIITYNHNAMLDVPLSAPFAEGANKTIAKDSFAKVPIFNLYYKRGGVMVNRKSERSRVKSFEDMKSVLRQGMHMCIYPEGTRNRTQRTMKPFYEGAFKLSVETGNKILPCVLYGTRQAMPIDKPFYLWPTKLQMHFMEPIGPAGKTSTELKDEVYHKMVEKYEALEALRAQSGMLKIK